VTLFIAGLAMFLGLHSLTLYAPGLRPALVARLGEGPWRGLYSLVALAGIVCMALGFLDARFASPLLYLPPRSLKLLSVLLMLPVFTMAAAAYLPGRIRDRLKYPLLVAVKTWALAHLLANGRLVDVLLFGGFLAWAVLLRIRYKRHPARAVVIAPPRPYNDLLAVGIGLLAYAVFLMGLHQRLFGVAPFG
jgi:uncharacterized membrane protein